MRFSNGTTFFSEILAMYKSAHGAILETRTAIWVPWPSMSFVLSSLLSSAYPPTKLLHSTRTGDAELLSALMDGWEWSMPVSRMVILILSVVPLCTVESLLCTFNSRDRIQLSAAFALWNISYRVELNNVKPKYESEMWIDALIRNIAAEFAVILRIINKPFCLYVWQDGCRGWDSPTIQSRYFWRYGDWAIEDLG